MNNFVDTKFQKGIHTDVFWPKTASSKVQNAKTFYKKNIEQNCSG